MLFDAVELHEREQNRRGLYIRLIFGVTAVGAILTELKAAGAAEHDVDDAEVAEDRHDPLSGACQCSKAGDEHARPDDQLTEVVRAAHELKETGVAEAAGIDLLGGGFLQVGGGLQNDAAEHDEQPDGKAGIARDAVGEAVNDGGGHHQIEQHAGKPQRDLERQGHVTAVRNFSLHLGVVRGAFQFAQEQIPAKTQTVADEQQAGDELERIQLTAVEDEQARANGGDGQSVADGDEPDVLAEADRAYERGGDKEEPE